jgi:hypothetical protein
MAKKTYRVLKFGGLAGGAHSQASIVTADDLRALDIKPAEVEAMVKANDLEVVDGADAPAVEPAPAERAKGEK